MRVRLIRIVILLAIVGGGLYLFDPVSRFLFSRQPPVGVLPGISLDDVPAAQVSTVATGLEIPWEIVFLPDSSLLVTERAGRLVHLTSRGRTAYPVAGVEHFGEAGLLGLALDPDFAHNRWLYLYLTSSTGGETENRIERYRFDAGLRDRAVILSGIPAEQFHDGGRLAFGPDGMLYATTGDALNDFRAQDRHVLSGKILRLRPPADDTPLRLDTSLVYSYGHRNPQGLAWDDRGRLWATEHGRSGVSSGLDELNLIQPGGNYGWPASQGDQVQPGTVGPVIHSGPDYAWAPAGLAYLNGSLFFGGLRGEALYQVAIGPGEGAQVRAHFLHQLGRIRAVQVGPDGMLYLATGNRDGRGRVRRGDDRIVRVDPTVFTKRQK